MAVGITGTYFVCRALLPGGALGSIDERVLVSIINLAPFRTPANRCDLAREGAVMVGIRVRDGMGTESQPGVGVLCLDRATGERFAVPDVERDFEDECPEGQVVRALASHAPFLGVIDIAIWDAVAIGCAELSIP